MKEIRCAIYTRKSSEEGLEQSFNSLDAQREACEAYIQSQKHEGWQVLPARYDDGGFSGGNMERPGLKRLLEDITAGRVDTVVVYKVDRLTRSLGDFARIVESFDSKGVSFVSVTQQFNTTTSMGRLTLNVLLSFAQFEREVTGERIRDKVAASKRKGMWMGGVVPLGYDLKTHQLIINEAEAEQVREIFRQYLRLGTFFELWEHLKRVGIRSKRRLSSTGEQRGENIISRGTLYLLLKNPVYIGKVRHKGNVYPGQHPPILSPELWTKVSEKLQRNRVERVTSRNFGSGRLLTGLLVDSTGNRFTSNYASKKGRRYDYYICQIGKDVQRLPAAETERSVASAVSSLLLNSLELSQHFAGLSVNDMGHLVSAASRRAEQLSDPTEAEAMRFLKTCVRKVVIGEADVRIDLARNALLEKLLGRPKDSAQGRPPITVIAPFQRKRRGSQVRLVLTRDGTDISEQVPSLIRAVALGRDWANQIIAGRSIAELSANSGFNRYYVGKILQCSALSPTTIDAILHGRQPADLTVLRLIDRLRLDWDLQALNLTK